MLLVYLREVTSIVGCKVTKLPDESYIAINELCMR